MPKVLQINCGSVNYLRKVIIGQENVRLDTRNAKNIKKLEENQKFLYLGWQREPEREILIDVKLVYAQNIPVMAHDSSMSLFIFCGSDDIKTAGLHLLNLHVTSTEHILGMWF